MALLIDESIYPSLESRLLRYEADVELQFPVNLTIRHDRAFNTMTPEAIRGYIHDLHYTNGVQGVVLAGSIPYSYWKNYGPGADDKGVNAFFYEDLDGAFEDQNSDGFYDYHTWGSHVGPEVWVAWMRPPANNQVGALQSFLDKTHDYYHGAVAFNHRALVAAHRDYDGNIRGGFEMVDRLAPLYGYANIDIDGEGADPVLASEYLAALRNNRYEICDAMGHAGAIVQAWDVGDVYSSDVRNMTGGAIMTFIYGCSSAAFHLSPSDNITMSYVFGDSIGQAASGTSWSYGTEGKWYIYDVLDSGGYLGQGWWNMEVTKNSPEYMRERYGNSLDTNRHLWGDTLVGNPFVFANYIPIPEPTLLLLLSSGATALALRRRLNRP